MEASNLKRIRDLEEENRHLKKMFADLTLENRALKDVLEKKPWSRLAGKAVFSHLPEASIDRYLEKPVGD